MDQIAGAVWHSAPTSRPWAGRLSGTNWALAVRPSSSVIFGLGSGQVLRTRASMLATPSQPLQEPRHIAAAVWHNARNRSSAVRASERRGGGEGRSALLFVAG